MPCTTEGDTSDIAVDSAEALAFLANFDSSSDGHLVIEEGRTADIKGTFFDPVAPVGKHVIDLRWAGSMVIFDISLLTHFK